MSGHGKTIEIEGYVCGSRSPSPHAVMVAEIHRTAPYSFEELGARWSCSVDTVERVVRHRFLKVGRTRMVRPGTLLKIEEEMEGAR